MLRAASIACVILVLAGTSAVIPAKNRYFAALIDVSESIGKAQVEKVRAALLKQISYLNPSDRISIVAFAGQPNVIIPLTNPEEASTKLESAALNAPDTGESDLRGGIQAAVEILSSKLGNRSIILFSDGRATAGGSINPILDKINGIPVIVIPVGEKGEGIVSREIKIPETAHIGEKIKAEWAIDSTREQNVNTGIKIDGQTVQKLSLVLKSGNNIIPIELTSERAGNHRVDIEMVSEDGNPVPKGNISGLLKVEGLSSILIIHGKNENPSLAESLKIQGLNVVNEVSSGIPESAGNLEGYSAVVFDNVPASFLSEKQQNVLQNYVAGGGGLFVIGGDSSFGRGEYYDSVLEEMIPVNTDIRQRVYFNRNEILFVIDHSGSMFETVGNTTKYDATISGIAAAVKGLNPQDRVGIIEFDQEAQWVLPLTQVSHQNEILKALSKIDHGGGTDMSSAFNEILRKFSNQEPVYRHLIIITDGQTEEKNFKTLTRNLHNKGFSVTTIGIGNEVNETLLKNIAEWGNGKFYRVNVGQIPKVIQKETVRLSRDLIQEGRFIPSVKTPSDVTMGFDRNLPPIEGYLLTRPKNLSSIYLEAGNNDPLLAEWRYGNGKVMVFTSDSGTRWLKKWSGTKSI